MGEANQLTVSPRVGTVEVLDPAAPLALARLPERGQRLGDGHGRAGDAPRRGLGNLDHSLVIGRPVTVARSAGRDTMTGRFRAAGSHISGKPGANAPAPHTNGKEPDMMGCFYDHGRWVALLLQRHPETGDTLVLARRGECPGDDDGGAVALARRPTAGAALDRALDRLTAGWRHASDEPPAPLASARAAIAHPAALRIDASVDRSGTRAQARAVVAYAASAHGRGFCFFGNPAAR